MSLPITIHHVQITVPSNMEARAIAFYTDVVGLTRVEKPELLRKNGGAYFQVGSFQLHVSLEDLATDPDQSSKRHVCFLVDDLNAAITRIEAAGGLIIPDMQPLDGLVRFYLRDPAGNRIEFAQYVKP